MICLDDLVLFRQALPPFELESFLRDEANIDTEGVSQYLPLRRKNKIDEKALPLLMKEDLQRSELPLVMQPRLWLPRDAALALRDSDLS